MKNILYITTLLFFLIACKNPIPGGKNLYEKLSKGIPVEINGKEFTRFIFHDTLYKPILFPINAPSGVEITRGYPLGPRLFERVDHPHQLGCWFTFGDVNGIDFWNNSYAHADSQRYKYGTILPYSFKTNKKKNTIEYQAWWIKSDSARLLKETSLLHFYGKGNTWYIDRETILEARRDITFCDNKEGMLGIRPAREFELPSNQPVTLVIVKNPLTLKDTLYNQGVNGTYMGNNGLPPEKLWGTANKWAVLSAVKDNDSISIAILDHPDNPGHEPHWHMRHYGLFSVDNFGRQAFQPELEEYVYKLPKGEKISFTYRIILHSNGYITRSEMENHYADFIKNK